MKHRRFNRLPRTIRLPPIHRRHPAVFGAAVLLSVLVWFGRSHAPQNVPPPLGGDYERYHGRVFTVVRVVDGDTLDIDAPDRDKPTTRIRLWGVDTPEVAGSPRGEMYWGPQASAFAKKVLLNNRVRIEMVDGDTRGKYGRLLAYVYLLPSGTMFNERLLREGYAYADPRFPHPLRDRFLSLEDEAHAARAGLWRGVTVDQMPGWRRRRGR